MASATRRARHSTKQWLQGYDATSNPQAKADPKVQTAAKIVPIQYANLTIEQIKAYLIEAWNAKQAMLKARLNQQWIDTQKAEELNAKIRSRYNLGDTRKAKDENSQAVYTVNGKLVSRVKPRTKSTEWKPTTQRGVDGKHRIVGQYISAAERRKRGRQQSTLIHALEQLKKVG